jgi:hypothetical protein
VLGAAVFAAALVFVSTRDPGPGLDLDSTAYVGAATSFVRDGTMRVPIANWDRPDSTSSLALTPPGFPIVMAGPMFAGASPIQSARWINILSAAVTAAAVALLIAAPLGDGAGIAGVLVVFATEPVLAAHMSVLSDPLFIALTLLLLAAMVHARDRLLVLTVLVTALAMLQYAGVAASIAVIVWMLIDTRYDVVTRLKRAAAIALAPAVAIALWLTRTAVVPDPHAAVSPESNGDWATAFVNLRDTFANWLVPSRDHGAGHVVIACVAMVVLFIFIVTAASDTMGNRLRRMRIGGVFTLIGAAALLAATYFMVVVLAYLFAGRSIPLDWKALAPLILLFEVAAVTAIGYWWRAYHVPMRAAVVVVALAWFGAASAATFSHVRLAATDGLGFAGSAWRASPLAEWVRANATGQPLYSNWPSALYFRANRSARQLPAASDLNDIDAFAARIRATGGYVIEFDSLRPQIIATETLASQVGLQRIVQVADGSVWAVTSAEPLAAPRDTTPSS